jgi:hypothetical protein
MLVSSKHHNKSQLSVGNARVSKRVNGQATEQKKIGDAKKGRARKGEQQNNHE